MAKQQGQRVSLIGLTLPNKIATEKRAIAIRSRRKIADVGRQFYDEFWFEFLNRHPDLKAMAEAGIPETEIKTESTEADAGPEKSEGEVAATA